MVGLCIADFEYFIRMQDGMGAEGDFARHLGGVDADGGFEPLTLVIHQRDEGDGSLADGRSEQREIVESLLWRRIEDFVFTQGFEPLRFVRRR